MALDRPDPIAARLAVAADCDQFVGLQRDLFVEDAGVYGAFADLTWPERKGHEDFEQLLGSDQSVVLVAEEAGAVIGFLAGYVSEPPPTRQSVKFAVLRSLFVAPTHRGRGAGELLCERFNEWGIEAGCVEAHVDAYAANEGAQRFYERLGFAPRSVSRVKPL